jgi:peroxiredoxin
MNRLLLCASLCAALAFGQEFAVGSKVADFSLKDLGGNTVSYSSLKGPVTVVVFISAVCPVSNSYNGRMNALYQDYTPKGVHFVFINSNVNESPAEVAAHAKSVGFLFPVYKDIDNKAADLFGAMATPESYVIDSSGTVRYHGYIDDSRFQPHVTRHGLRDALDQVLAGKEVAVPRTKAFGCSIKRARNNA